MREVTALGTSTGASQSPASRLPLAPVMPTIVHLRSRAAITPASTLGEVPLVLSATTTSPGFASASIWRAKTRSKP